MKHYKNILTSDIPHKGRYLKSTECKRLRDNGVSCSTSWYIIRYNNYETVGTLYKSAFGCRINSGIVVED